MSETILIVEDDESLRRALARYLKRSDYHVIEAATLEAAHAALDAHSEVGTVITDVVLPDGGGFELVDRSARDAMAPSIIVMTGEDDIDHPISALKRGAADFLLKPFSFEALDEALRRAASRGTTGLRKNVLPRTPIESWRSRYAPEIVGSHTSLMDAFSIIERVADTDCSVMITGESGTGKELVARAVHKASDRSSGPFVTVNCAAIPENLLESELFGHVRGAFTGATVSRQGRFAAADGGTIFLDEIGELPLALQSKLLRVLQEKEVCAVGDSKVRKVDVRIVAATNRDLDEMVQSRTFREDLLYRINVIPIALLPLRERRRDIVELVETFVGRTNERRGRSITGISDEAMEALVAFNWPGNIRQLENTIERIVVLKTEGSIDLEDLPERIRKAQNHGRAVDQPELPADGIDLRDAVEKFENALILQALERTGWNKNQAASILRMNRTTLVEKLKKRQFSQAV